jgi:hypothetical protein
MVAGVGMGNVCMSLMGFACIFGLDSALDTLLS